MTPPAMRRHRLWPWAIVAGVVLCPGLALLALIGKSEARLSGVRGEVAAELVRRASQGFDRTPILEPASPGDVAEAYDEAFRLLAGVRSEPLQAAFRRASAFLLSPGTMPTDQELSTVEEPLGDVIEAVRNGLRRSQFRFDLDYSRGLTRWADRRNGRPLEAALFLEADRARAQARDVDALRAWVALLGFAGDDLRGLDAYWAVHRPDSLFAACWLLDRLLAAHHLPAGELRDALRALERIEATWPGIEEAARIHFLLCQQSVVSGDDGALSAPDPGWRHLWCRSVVDASLLNALDREERLFTGLFALSPERRTQEARRLDDLYLAAESLGRARNWHGFELYVFEDLRRRSRFGLLKIALALAWHEAETGRPVDRLEDLVPGRLPDLPLCLRTGKPFGYAPGRVWWEGYDEKDDGGKPLPADLSYLDGDVVIRVHRGP